MSSGKMVSISSLLANEEEEEPIPVIVDDDDDDHHHQRNPKNSTHSDSDSSDINEIIDLDAPPSQDSGIIITMPTEPVRSSKSLSKILNPADTTISKPKPKPKPRAKPKPKTAPKSTAAAGAAATTAKPKAKRAPRGIKTKKEAPAAASVPPLHLKPISFADILGTSVNPGATPGKESPTPVVISSKPKDLIIIEDPGAKIKTKQKRKSSPSATEEEANKKQKTPKPDARQPGPASAGNIKELVFVNAGDNGQTAASTPLPAPKTTSGRRVVSSAGKKGAKKTVNKKEDKSDSDKSKSATAPSQVINPYVDVLQPYSVQEDSSKKQIASPTIIPITRVSPQPPQLSALQSSSQQKPSPEIKCAAPKPHRTAKLSDLLNSDDDKVIEVLDDDEEDDDDDDEKEVDLDAEEDDDDEYEGNLKKKSEIPLLFDIPLNKIDADGKNTMVGGQVIINVMKLAEEKYGFKTIHPNANFAIDALKDDLFDDDMDIMGDPLSIPGNTENNELLKEFKKTQLKLQKEKEEKLQEQLQLQQDQSNEENMEESQKKIREMITKNNRKIGKYDYDDPFIDDTELLWEETRAVTKDGFFVYWGPLVEEAGQINKIAIASKDASRNTTKNTKTVKKYRSKPGPKSRKEKEAIERERQLQEQAKSAASEGKTNGSSQPEKAQPTANSNPVSNPPSRKPQTVQQSSAQAST
ncbi:Hpc2 protein [Saccharomycopsis crataegensis]|uniref:Hpc2 protein n=1 Tax=Saccharomycopsis crataegensis TaxID=43959 RepID=A0AAV5QU48_9ASCO|nr:Hpc2 protein [Saccharomycopsis crataegensis]